MFALCLESSHARGMGHLYRMINLADALQHSGYKCKFIINEDIATKKVLQLRSYDYKLADLKDFDSGWEEELIKNNEISVWINDRLDTHIKHSQRIKKQNIVLVTFDDFGSGAEISDLQIAALAFNDKKSLYGKSILRGIEYLILNPEIIHHRRLRNSIQKILVTLGGSDTYGVTIEVIRKLIELGREATVIIGPGFQHFKELDEILMPNIKLKQNVSSLIEEFSNHDLAITGGGITPFEANASGLPCIVIANEKFEIPIGEKLQRLGGSIFIGHYKNFHSSTLDLELPIKKMSQAGIDNIALSGSDTIVKALKKLIT